ncbi:MAG: hypothetical protein EA428_11610 [Spirochaetaceae bacterium]|nr:MAG: hypothetical protein EA428_11610 [Spirochaetaceae bacterium]
MLFCRKAGYAVECRVRRLGGVLGDTGMHIVLAGAGHTHIELLRCGSELTRAGHELTLVSPEPYHAYSGMGPGLLSGIYSEPDIVLPAAALARRAGARYIPDRIVSCDISARVLTLASGAVCDYDLLSLNLGSEPVDRLPDSAAGRRVYMAKPIRELSALRGEIERRCRDLDGCEVSVVGAGAAGLEIAANATNLLSKFGPQRSVVNLFSSNAAPAGLTGRRREYVERHLARIGVSFFGGMKVQAAEVPGDIVVIATGLRPPQVLRSFDLALAPDGSVRVDRYLRSQSSSRVFAVGDCAYFAEQPLDRVGVYAVRQQAVLMANLMAAAARADTQLYDSAPLSPFSATGPYLAGFNLGYGCGLLYKGSWTLSGRAAFVVKDRIDRAFMRRYQK